MRGGWRCGVVAGVTLTLGGAVAHPPASTATVGQTRLISASPTGQAGNGESRGWSISADGRGIAFASHASNLVEHDTNSARDIFVRDAVHERTVRVSIGRRGQANGPSARPLITDDGRYVVFASRATNLRRHGDDTNGHWDVFRRDTVTLRTRMVSLTRRGTQFPGNSFPMDVSPGGRFVLFITYPVRFPFSEPGVVYVGDLRRGTLRRLVAINGDLWFGGPKSPPPGRIASGGRFAAVGYSYQGGGTEVFDLRTGRSQLPPCPDGDRGTDCDSTLVDMSPGGRYVLYPFWTGTATLLVLWDRRADRTRVLVRQPDSSPPAPVEGQGISAAGTYVLAGTRFGPRRLRSLVRIASSSGHRTPVGVTAEGAPVQRLWRPAAMSADGRFVVFNSRRDGIVEGDANHLTDVFMRGPLPSR
jgi:hypothetical protein